MDQSQAPESSHNQTETADYQTASQSTADFIKQIAPLREAKRKRHKRRIVLIIILVVAIIGGGGYAAYRYFSRAQTKQHTPTSKPKEQAPKEVPLEKLTSQALGLSLEYPANWTTDEGTTGQLSMLSPKVKLLAANNKQVESRVALTILASPGALPDFGTGPAVAVRDSLKFAYQAPSQTQRGETYLSFISFADPKAVDAIYITGNKGYQTGGQVTKEDVSLVVPTIRLQFYRCADDACELEDAEPLSIDPGAWDTDPTLKAAFAILKSLTIQ